MKEQGVNLLIVEEANSNSWLQKREIERWGHSVEWVECAWAALRRLRQRRFDLVLVDIYLPDCMGHELIPRFKEIWPDIGVVVMTGYNSRELELEVRRQGVIYYMIKPFSLEVLREILDHMVIKKEREVEVR